MSSPRTGLSGAVYAFAISLLLTVVASEALVMAVARMKVGGDAGRVHEAERAFALSADGLMAGACLEGLLLLGVAMVSKHMEGPESRRLAFGRSRATPAGGTAAVVGLVGLSFACGAALELAGLGGAGVMDTLARALYRPSPVRLGLGMVTIALVPAIGEEALFRGFIQTRLGEHLGRWPAIVLTSCAFGLFHRDLRQGTVAFLAGLFLGWTADRMGGLRPSIAAHTVNNATFVLLASLGAASTLPAGAQLASLAGGATLCAASAAVIGQAGRTTGRLRKKVRGEPPSRKAAK